MKSNENIWSPYPREACKVRLENGMEVGFGADSIFDLIPGAWNIFWLTFAQLDQTAYYSGDVNQYLVSCESLPVCVGAALQVLPDAKIRETLGGLAARVSPSEFIAAVANFGAFLPVVFYGERWFNVAAIRSANYKKANDNVIYVDFRKGSRSESL